MNDLENLYFAVRYKTRIVNEIDHVWYFDGDLDGYIAEWCDDGFGNTRDNIFPPGGLPVPLGYLDVWASEDEGFAHRPFIREADPDGDPMGIANGDYAFAATDEVTVYEFSHPLHNIDNEGLNLGPLCNSRDMQVWPGMDLRTGPVHFGNGYRIHTVYPGNLPVTIDIRPYFDGPTIDCTNPDFAITAVILGSAQFDASRVDWPTLTLAGATELHRLPNGGPAQHLRDFDGDGDLDAVLHVRMGDTTLDCSSTVAVLEGKLFSSQPIRGSDAVPLSGGS
jgi:hypothetical protein